MFLLFALVLLAPFVAVRLFFLVPTRFGWINYLANVLSETFFKKAGWSRATVEAALAGVGLLLLALAGVGLLWVFAVALLLLLLELYASRFERHLLDTVYAPLDTIGIRRATPEQTRGLALGYPSPSTHPELTLNLIGPFVARTPRYELGTLVVGRIFELRLLVGNHTLVPTQTAIRLRVEHADNLVAEPPAPASLPRLASGQVHELRLRWKVIAPSGAGAVRLHLEWSGFQRTLAVHFTDCVAPAGLAIAAATITRYPGACRAAFAWRGDMDLYDESTLQSIEGLTVTLELAARYRMPQTMYLSTRLSLDHQAATDWAAHYGVDRGAARIPEFIEWFRDRVELRLEARYPYTAGKPYLMELGNHGHLHFGTDTAGAAENGWKPKARMGAGSYSWLGSDRSSFAEQRDNALEARRWCERCFGFSPKSWAMPNRTNDRHTAAAMEAAGCEVLSDSNVSARHNVLLQPPPHHPPGTKAVELTKRYPGDPQHPYHVAMNLFWLHRAHRKGLPVIFMCHQHLRQFAGYACTRFTEYTLRYALTRFAGDLHINTVYGIGKYWREVLSPQTRSVRLSTEGATVRLHNGSDVALADTPVDVTLNDGRRFTLLCDVPPGAVVTIPLLPQPTAQSSPTT